jgi:hypothetical protein
VSCKTCAETYEIDDIEPDCWSKECLVPEVDAWGQRIFEIRDRLITLKDLVDPGTILKLYNADLDDLELLAAVEEQLQEIHKEEKPQQEA